MLRHISWASLSLFLLFAGQLVVAVTDKKLPMDRWQQRDKHNKILQKWVDEPTWHKEVTLHPFDLVPGYDQVLAYANQYYNWLSGQPHAKTKKGHSLVATLYVPTTRTLYSSTIPQGPQKGRMLEDTSNAPLWAEQAKKLIGKQRGAFHAEDGAFYNYETISKAKGHGKYPDGTIVAIWGQFKSDFDSKKDSHEAPPCNKGTSNARDPSCEMVAGALNVKTAKSFNKVVPESATQAAENNSADEFDDPDALAAMMEWEHSQGTPARRRRGASVDATLLRRLEHLEVGA